MRRLNYWRCLGRLCYALVLGIAMCGATSAAAGQPMRLQIVGDASNPDSGVEENARLLEKSDGISIVSSAESASAVTVAPDVIVYLNHAADNDGPTRALVAFDAGTGLRIQDTQLPQSIGQVASDAILDSLRQAVDRHRHPPAATHWVSIVSTRNVDVAQERRGQIEQLSQCFERELFGAASTAILQRSQLDLGAGSSNRPRPHDRSTLLAASTLIVLDVSKVPGSTSEVSATAVLSDPSGGQQGKVTASGSINDAGALAHALAQQAEAIIAGLPAAAASNANDSIEARRFSGESRLAFSEHHWDIAASAAGAAVALAPAVREYRRELVHALTFEGVCSISPNATEGLISLSFAPPDLNWDRTLATLERASGLLLQSGDDPYAMNHLTDAAQLLHQFCITMLEQDGGFTSAGALARPDAQGQFTSPAARLSDSQNAALSRIIWNDRNYLVKVVLPAQLAAVQDNASFETYTASLMTSLGEECHIFSRSKQEYLASATKQLINWAALAGKYAPEHEEVYSLGWEDYDSAPLHWVQDLHDWERAQRPPCFGKVTKEDAVQWEKLVDALKQANAPLRLYINLENYLKRIEQPEMQVQDAPPEPAQVQIKLPPPAAAQSSPSAGEHLPLLYSRSVALIDSQVGQVDPYCINMPIAVGDQLYVVELGDRETGGNEIRVLKGPADASEPLKVVKRLGDVPDSFVQACRADGNSFFQMPRFLGSSHLILSSNSGLIFALALGDGASAMIDARKELPAEYVQSAADLGDTIYMVVANREGSTWLVSYDLRNKKMQTLSASSRGESTAPFDNIAPMSASYIWSDPPRNRIVFFAYHSTWDDATKGIWEYNATSGKFIRLLPTSYSRKEGAGGYEVKGTPVVDQKFMLLTGQRLVFDLAQNAAIDDVPTLEFPKIFESWWKRYGDPGGAGVGSGDNTIEKRVGSIHALNQLWQGGYPMYTFDVPDGRLLVADWSGIWLLTPVPL